MLLVVGLATVREVRNVGSGPAARCLHRPRERVSGPGGTLAFNQHMNHMILRVDLVDSHGRTHTHTHTCGAFALR